MCASNLYRSIFMYKNLVKVVQQHLYLHNNLQIYNFEYNKSIKKSKNDILELILKIIYL